MSTTLGFQATTSLYHAPSSFSLSAQYIPPSRASPKPPPSSHLHGTCTRKYLTEARDWGHMTPKTGACGAPGLAWPALPCLASFPPGGSSLEYFASHASDSLRARLAWYLWFASMARQGMVPLAFALALKRRPPGALVNASGPILPQARRRIYLYLNRAYLAQTCPAHPDPPQPTTHQSATAVTPARRYIPHLSE